MSEGHEVKVLVEGMGDHLQDCAASQEVSCIQEGLLSFDVENKVLDPAKVDQDDAAAGPDQEANDMTCAICLEQIPLEEMCIVKGCEHVYCGKCILAWAVQKEPVWCPQCKAPFANLLTYRKLDGTLSDFPVEESVCLLKRAHWFEAHMKEVEKGKAAIEFVPPQLVMDDARDWVDWREDSNADYRRFEEQYEDDEEVEDFYFSSAAGRLRIVGNRRFGENGFISSGRMQARPVPQPRPSKGKAQAGADSTPVRGPAEHQASHKMVRSATKSLGEAASTPNRRGKAGADTDAPDSSGSSGGGGKQGRRARRKEKMASADARARLLSSP
ncbi:hypothetical protein COCOBI_10-3410 [Coccomyxa sp. Obi]|nr:hypothetical protein COCOBI_10-3410 [Coccomyxa sp. Obi]